MVSTAARHPSLECLGKGLDSQGRVDFQENLKSQTLKGGMMRFLCWLSFHNWLLNSDIVYRYGTIRLCRRCGREEIVVGWNTKVIWSRLIKSNLR